MREALTVATLAFGALAFGPLSGPGVAAAQDGGVRRVPFGPGERAEYDVSLGLFGDVGEGSMEVVGIENVRGHRTYRLRFELEGRVAFAKVDDLLESWLDVGQLFSRRYHQDQHEVNYQRKRTYEFVPDSMLYRRLETGNTDTLASARPLDEVAFLYYVRTLPFEVGKTYTFDRYYKRSGNPVTLKVLRKETIKGIGGADIPVVVVQPIIRTSGLFGEGGEAEVYFTDDWRRILVKMTSKVPVIGRLGLTLKGYTAGQPLTPTAAGRE